MLRFRRPDDDIVSRFLAAQSKLPFSYAEVGASFGAMPAGYAIDRRRVFLGRGEAVFRAARACLLEWRQYPADWITIHSGDHPPEPGRTIAAVMHRHGVWLLAASRVVEVVDQPGPDAHYSFAYGTLPAHVERGEERFTVSMRSADRSVWYEIAAFSRPAPLWARLGRYWVRRAQRAFFAASEQAVRRAVASATSSNDVSPPAHV